MPSKKHQWSYQEMWLQFQQILFIISVLQDIYRNSLVSEERMKIKYTPEYVEVLLKYFQLIWVAVCTKIFNRKRRILWLNLIWLVLVYIPFYPKKSPLLISEVICQLVSLINLQTLKPLYNDLFPDHIN